MNYIKSLGIGALALCLLSLSASADATGWSSAVGTYGFSVTEHCVETPRVPPPAQGYDPATGKLLKAASAVTAVLSGKMRLRRNGTLSWYDTRISDLFLDRTLVGDVPIATGVAVTCSGTYSTSAASELSAEMSCKADVPGGIVVEIGPFVLEGFLDPVGLSGVLSSIEGNLQTEAVVRDGTRIAERERACVVSGHFVRL